MRFWPRRRPTQAPVQTPAPAAHPAPAPAPAGENLFNIDPNVLVGTGGGAPDLLSFSEEQVAGLEQEAGPGTSLAVPRSITLRDTVARILAWDARVSEEWATLERAARGAAALKLILERGRAGEVRNAEVRKGLEDQAGQLNELIAGRGSVGPQLQAPALEPPPGSGQLPVSDEDADAVLAEARRIVGGA